MDFLFLQLLSGLASGSVLFLIASGLTIIFGVTRTINFAHGALAMLGAYLGWSATEALGPDAGLAGWMLGILLAGLGVGLLGAVIEVALLRRLYGTAELYPLLATFGLVLVIDDAALALWGPQDLLGAPAPGLDGSLALAGGAVPVYDLALIALCPLILLGLHLLMTRTRWGLCVRAATEDRDMVAALGVDHTWLFTGVFCLGSTLAGLGGALQLPREAVTLDLGLQWIVEAFVVVVVGGMGSIVGAYLAALLVGLLHAFGILLFPEITLVLTFLLMAVVLVVRPQGLFGHAPAGVEAPAAGRPPPPLRRPPVWLPWFGTAILAGLFALPLVTDRYTLIVLTEIVILGLYTASLQLVMGQGGMISFGHAAYFGLGAYGAALLVDRTGAAMVPALIGGVLLAGAGAALFGWFCVRRSGVYMAMLTLAFAQITWSTSFQWYNLTGGDNGILGIWPPAWAASQSAFYLFSLTVCLGAWLLLVGLARLPAGFALRGTRDSPLRAGACGIDPGRIRWLAFTLGGSLAGLAGGLYAFSRGSVFPALLEVSLSLDGLIMMLLGGVHSLVGPLLGAAVFHGLKAELMRLTELWRSVVGASVILLVLAFPHGLTGFAGRLWARAPTPIRDRYRNGGRP